MLLRKEYSMPNDTLMAQLVPHVAPLGSRQQQEWSKDGFVVRAMHYVRCNGFTYRVTLSPPKTQVFQWIYLQMRCPASHLRGCTTAFQKRWVTGRTKQGALQKGTCHLMQGLTYARTNDSTHIPKQYGPVNIVLRSLQVRKPSRTEAAAVQGSNPFPIL